MKEYDIRKKEAFDKYLKLVRKDARRFFDFNAFIDVRCPACFGHKAVPEFNKSGFTYALCPDCATLFVNPRPPFDALKRFYTQSPSTSFFVNEFFKPVAQVRKKKIFKPRAEYLSSILPHKDNNIIGDIGAGFGLFLEEIRRILPSGNFVAIEPSDDMAELCAKKGFSVRHAYFEEIRDISGKFDVLTAFELVEHLFDPASFFRKARSLLKPGGHFFFTTLNGMGFDILTLWNRSKSVSPPHHLNFFNTRSIRILLEELDFEIIDIATPGKLDWDIVEGMVKNENVSAGRFCDFLAREGSRNCKSEFQRWISRNNLSSHMSVLIRRKTG